MKITFYGSCQLQAISKLMNSDSHEFQVILNWVYILGQLPLPEINPDIFIYQVYNPIGKNKNYHTNTVIKMLKEKNPNVILISVPFLDFNGYWPDHIVDPRNELTKSDALPYGLFPQQSGVLSSYTSFNELLRNYNNQHYPEEYIKKHIQTALNKLEVNEKNCNIKVSQFIKKYYLSKQLFYSIQHPCNEVLYHMTQQINNILNWKTNEWNFPEKLKDHSVLVLPCIQKVLNFNVQNYKVYGRGMVSEKEYLQLYFKFINSNN